MSVIDIILIVCFIPAVVQGLTKGFIRQIFGIAAIIAGAWASYSFSDTVTGWLSGLAGDPDSRIIPIISYALTAIVVIVVFILLGNLLSKTLDHMTLGALNRILGMAFSLVKTALILMLLIMLFEQINSSWHLVGKNTLGGSVIYDALRNLSLKVFPFLKDLVGGLADV